MMKAVRTVAHAVLAVALLSANLLAQDPYPSGLGASELRGNVQQPPAPAVVQSYQIAGNQLELLVAEFREQYAGQSDVRIAGDRRTGQLLVLAPMDVQRVIAGRLAALGQPANGVTRAVASPAAFVVPLSRADPRTVQRAVQLVRGAAVGGEPDQTATLVPLAGQRGAKRWGGDLVSMIFQQEGEQVAQPAPGEGQFAPAGDANQPGAMQPAPDEGEGALIGDVRIEYIEGLDVIIIRGHKRDVEKVARIIEEIERQSLENRPVVEVLQLRHVNSQALADLIVPLYDQVLLPRQGRVSITSLIKPNALLLIGSKESVQTVVELVDKLDRPVPPATQFKVFQLRYMSAVDAYQRITEAFTEPAQLAPRVRVVADYRSNSVIVQASPRDMTEVTRMLQSIDVKENAAVNEVRIFRLSNALATDLAAVIQDAINGQLTGAGRGTTGAAGAGQVGAGQQGAGQNVSQIRSAMLQFLTVDSQGRRLLKSGILFDVRVTADTNANALVVTGPPESMELVAALIQQLDQLPTPSAQIKVFTIANGDATRLANMLQLMFSQTAQGGQAGQGGGVGQVSATGAGESSLVPLRFGVDERTNSIIATGASGDLLVVEAILVRLDEGDLRQRKTTVYRLKNAPAQFVADAINLLINNKRQILQQRQQQFFLVPPLEQVDQEVFVVPEIVSNSLIVSATPRYYDEINDVVERLDMRPSMVMIQVVIAEVTLNDASEFGVELGLQDSLLFDRGVGVVGFPFNQSGLGNNSDARSLNTRETLGGQALSNLSVGRTNATLGYGGLVLSAGNESVNILIRALQDKRRAQILSRPQIMTLDNQPASVLVGQRVPRITNTTLTNQGTTNSVVLDEVGLQLAVTPRISPDGLVVMNIDAIKSSVGDINQGIPISINQNGDVIRSPIYNTSEAHTTISARDGQTVVFAGLITKTRNFSSRRTPYLSDIPVLGRLFTFDSQSESRTELLIIMTPHIIKGDEDVDRIKFLESDRMSWCLADVVEMHGNVGLSGGHGLWGPAKAPVIFPDLDPSGELVPTPADTLGNPRLMLPDQSSNQFNPGFVPPAPALRTPGARPGSSPVVQPAVAPADGSAYPYGNTQAGYAAPPNRGFVAPASYEGPTPANPNWAAPAGYHEPVRGGNYDPNYNATPARLPPSR
jgi:general secretion pathway protein D